MKRIASHARGVQNNTRARGRARDESDEEEEDKKRGEQVPSRRREDGGYNLVLEDETVLYCIYTGNLTH